MFDVCADRVSPSGRTSASEKDPDGLPLCDLEGSGVRGSMVGEGFGDRVTLGIR